MVVLDEFRLYSGLRELGAAVAFGKESAMIAKPQGRDQNDAGQSCLLDIHDLQIPSSQQHQGFLSWTNQKGQRLWSTTQAA
jgi:hypothetical protein